MPDAANKPEKIIGYHSLEEVARRAAGIPHPTIKFLKPEEEILAEFEELIANTPDWHPPAPPSEIIVPGEPSEWVELSNDNLDTVADAFGQWSRDKCGVIHRFNSVDGWTIYHNNRYQRVESEDAIKGYISTFICKYVKIKKRVKQEDGSFKQTLIRPTNKMMVSSYVTNVLKTFRRSDTSVYLRPSQKQPCSLDGKHNPNAIIAMKNGLLDRSAKPRVLYPHTPEYYTLNYLDYDYNPDIYSEKWVNFLIEITNSDPDLIRLLQQWCGYLLMNTVKHQKFLLCVGDGANGKGVFFDTITAALGRLNVSNVPLAAFDQSAKIYATYGKMVNMSNESPKYMEEAAESIIKEYVGGDKMVWERKYKDAFSDYPTAKLMFAMNELPPIRDITDGIWRRMMYIPFDVQFKGSKQNADLSKQLQEPKELAGILNWMLDGIEDLEKSGKFVTVQRCVDGLETYKKESNPTQTFIDENVIDSDPDDYVPTLEVYQLYAKWCDERGCYKKNDNHFGRALTKSFPAIVKRRITVNEKRQGVYCGVRLLNVFDIGDNDIERNSSDLEDDRVTGAENIPF